MPTLACRISKSWTAGHSDTLSRLPAGGPNGGAGGFLLDPNVCDKPAKAAGAPWEIKAVRFPKMILEALLAIAHHRDGFR